MVRLNCRLTKAPTDPLSYRMPSEMSEDIHRQVTHLCVYGCGNVCVCGVDGSVFVCVCLIAHVEYVCAYAFEWVCNAYQQSRILCHVIGLPYVHKRAQRAFLQPLQNRLHHRQKQTLSHALPIRAKGFNQSIDCRQRVC